MPATTATIATTASTAVVGFEPRPPGGDPLVERFCERRVEALGKVTGRLAQRLPRDAGTSLQEAAARVAALPDEQRTPLLLGAAHSHWWFRLSSLYREGDGRALAAWSAELNRFLPVPALAAGAELEIDVPVVRPGELRLPGATRHLAAAALTAPAARVRVEGGRLAVLTGEGAVEVGAADLLGGSVAPGAPVVTRPTVPGTGLEVDASDPWTHDFLDHLNRIDPWPGLEVGDMRPAPTSPACLHALGRAVADVRRSWPAMAGELLGYVGLVVPFASAHKDAFSNTAWQGAVFLQDDFADPVFALERLVHEASHVRLNLVMALDPLHDHGWDDRVPSPFRAGPRPVTGLYHGAFVFTRVAVALDRCHRDTGDPAYAERVPVLLAKVEASLATLREHVRLTAAGAGLLDEVGDACADVRTRHPAGGAAPAGPDRYLDD